MFKNMRISAKLGWGYSIILLLLALLAGSSILAVIWLGNAVQDIYEHPFTVSRNIRTVHINILLADREIERLFQGRSGGDIGQTVARLDELSGSIDSSLQIVQKQYLGDTKTTDDLVGHFRTWDQQRKEVVSMYRENRKDEARVRKDGRYAETMFAMESEIKEISAYAAGKADYFFGGTRNVVWTNVTIIGLLFAGALGLIVALWAYLVRSINDSLKVALDVSERLSAGEVGIEFPPPCHDEIGMILESLRRVADEAARMAVTADGIASGDLTVRVHPRSGKDRLGLAMLNMVEYLNKTAKAAERIASGDLTVEIVARSEQDAFGGVLSAMVNNLRHEIRQMKDGVGLLSASVNQIMTSTAELASIASQTAAAVNQTTTTMEEVRHTSLLSNQKAGQVSEAAGRSVEVSREGRDSIESTFKMLESVQRSITSIAERMDMLSEKTQAIGEIILSVNDLAEQSNLLAVNASIEAVKAGEFGRGFAVVAEEVRSLSEQSKMATAQVRSILSDIRKATSAAVTSVDQGAKVVSDLVRQSEKASTSIRTLSASVVESSDSAAQIAASIGQQLAGVDQVVQAMDNIRQASRQNAESARQLETAARGLKEFGNKLQNLASRYNV